ncbi:MAG: hypothetical protein HFI75_10495 [Lachnospiraceae bacterium]|nr:hypothetical protein [Lachnospiraceae bacterium]
MNEQELTSFLVKSAEGNRNKYLPWWEVDEEAASMYRYDMFTEEEVRAVNEQVQNCSKECYDIPIGSLGMSLLHLLVWCGFYEAVQCALEQGIHVDYPVTGKNPIEDDCRGATPLMFACCRGNGKMVQLLLEHGADSGLCDEKGRTAYHYLAGLRLYNLYHGSDLMRHGLLEKARIARLLNTDINAKDKEGRTPLEQLVGEGSSNCSWALTAVFIEKGADIRSIDEHGASLLLRAIRNNHITAALLLLEDDTLINQPDKEGRTPLHLAVERRNQDLCIALLDHHADKNAQNSEGNSPKDLALALNDEEWKKIFSGRLPLNTLSRYAGNAFARYSRDERDPISMALYLSAKLIREVDEDDDEELHLLIDMLHNALMSDEDCRVLDLMNESGVDFTMRIHRGGSVECIRDYCLSGNFGLKVIRKLQALGLDLNEPVIKGRTPVHLIASRPPRMTWGSKKDDYFEKAAQFFSSESMEYVDDFGITALHEAARNGHADMLRVMLEKGADPNVTMDEPADAGNTPLHVACENGKAEAVRVLMAAGADDMMQNIQGETPAHLAVKKKFGKDLEPKERTDVLEALQHVDIPANDGRTPLLTLQSLDRFVVSKVMPVLLDQGVDVNHTDNSGNTALIATAWNGSMRDNIKELVRAGADVNAVNERGDTALHYVLKFGDSESARFLIKKGADYNCANNEGVTPAQIAVEKGYDTVLELMTDLA